ncbi:hypothetical protein SDC9_203928 [bioreactor metagenome]|uniref:Uncharacterized protein n=1 Tax=bioreactor metagenome TaxID=1076179 RepID=A0A645IZF1_9ZZZZ
MGDDINIPPVKGLVELRLIVVWSETFCEDHVRGTEPAGVSATEQNRILRHPGVERLFAIAKGWTEHIMAEPVSEPVVPLFIIRPMSHD